MRSLEDDDDDGGNGTPEGCLACRFDIKEMKMMIAGNTNALQSLTEVLDDRVSQLITLLDKRLDAPWAAMSRMTLVIGIVVVGFMGSVFIARYGILETKSLVESIRK